MATFNSVDNAIDLESYGAQDNPIIFDDFNVEMIDSELESSNQDSECELPDLDMWNADNSITFNVSITFCF